MEVTYIIDHNSCSEGEAKFVWPPLHMILDDIKLKMMLNHLLLVLLQQMVAIGNLCNIKK